MSSFDDMMFSPDKSRAPYVGVSPVAGSFGH
jgi:hypothetical protein